MRFHQAVTFLPTRHALALAQAADAQGYDGLYLSDHMFFPATASRGYTYSTREDGAPGFGEHWDPDTDWPDVWCLISAMAAVTDHVHFTTGVYVAPARDLITVAKQVATAAVISEGRVALGVGVGWCKEEFDATGQDFHTRGKRLDDMIHALRASWGGGWVEYHGPRYDVPAMRMEPTPPGPIPIIGGGHSAPALRRAAALCDGWVSAGAYKPDDARAYLTQLHEARRLAGRAGALRHLPLAVGPPRRRPLPQLRRGPRRDRHPVTPAMMAEVDPADPPEVQLGRRLDASARFADEVVAKMR